jgi:hypothetical protein
MSAVGRISLFSLLFIWSSLAQLAAAQTSPPIGTVGMQDATVAGALEVTNGRAVLVGNTTVTARDHVAEVELNRGGTVRVCSTSGLHLTAGRNTNGTTGAPLMLGLDRGAIELQMAGTTRDVVTTPDLRFTLGSDGPLDLQLRVTRNGDTCVENRGAKAPVLHVADQFGEASYELRAGQHVLFEHGSLKEVVDHESSACGCPPEPSPDSSMSIADALLHPGASGGGATAEKTPAEQHPFPAAVSTELAPTTVPQAAPGAVHAQVSATLNSGGGADSLAVQEKPSDAAANAAGPAPAAAAQEPAQQKKGVLHAVGRFFKRIFGGD